MKTLKKTKTWDREKTEWLTKMRDRRSEDGEKMTTRENEEVGEDRIPGPRASFFPISHPHPNT
jgi:hypothetical protein